MVSVASPVPTPAAAELRPTGLLRWVTSVDHKDIGVLYLLTSLGFFVLGGIEALLMRIQLAVPRNSFLDPGAYDAVFTVHGTTMIFLVVMPVLLGFSNYIVPLQIGARDMAFPRLNALSYWLFLFGGLVLYWGFLNGTPPDTGWFSYAPLSEKPFSLENGVDYWALGLLVTSAGTIATGVNLLVTVVTLRAPGMGMFQVPIFSWMALITAWLCCGSICSGTSATPRCTSWLCRPSGSSRRSCRSLLASPSSDMGSSSPRASPSHSYRSASGHTTCLPSAWGTSPMPSSV